MATSVEIDRAPLVDSITSDSSFDIIDPNFDPAFQELIGVATADHIPLDKEDVLMRKGDCVRIEQESLDRESYIVTVMQTGERGKVPKDFVRVGEGPPNDSPTPGSKFTGSIEWESDEETKLKKESPLKRPQAIVRRAGVEKGKRPVFKTRVNGVDIDQRPLLEETLTSAMENDKRFTASEQVSSGMSAVARLRALTREDRVNSLQEPKPEFKLIEKYNILSVGGSDKEGRMVIVFSACRLPDSYLIDHQRLLEYLFYTLDKYVEQDYTVIYFHHGFTSANKPSLSWLKQIYKQMDRKYKKNIKKFYIVHPTNFIRVMYFILKPLISYKFGQKLVYINRLDELRPLLYLDQIDIPDEVKRYDLTLTTSVRDVIQPESRSVFHVPVSAANVTSEPSTASTSTRQFGVGLEELRAQQGGDPVPLVIKMCVQFIKKRGMNVVGIFRRAPNNVTLRQIKDKFDRGETVDLEEMGDCHLAAVLIKLLLRELPQPLLTFQAYSSIVEIRGKSEEDRLEICSKVLDSLPQTNYIVLHYIMEFLSKVAANHEENKMTELNLAIVFGPNLVWSDNQTANLSSLGEINSFTMLLIQHFNTLFNK